MNVTRVCRSSVARRSECEGTLSGDEVVSPGDGVQNGRVVHDFSRGHNLSFKTRFKVSFDAVDS